MTVLIVDDNQGIRRLLRRIVMTFSSSVWECADGAAALAAYRQFIPDVVLMDLRMPVMEGLEATRRLLAFDPAACVIIVTDYDDSDVRDAAFQAGASGYVLKSDVTTLPDLLRASPTRNGAAAQSGDSTRLIV